MHSCSTIKGVFFRYNNRKNENAVQYFANKRIFQQHRLGVPHGLELQDHDHSYDHDNNINNNNNTARHHTNNDEQHHKITIPKFKMFNTLPKT